MTNISVNEISHMIDRPWENESGKASVNTSEKV